MTVSRAVRSGWTEPAIGPGVADSLPAVLDAWRADRVLVVATPGAVRRTRLRDWTAGRAVTLFQNFGPNPQLSSVLLGVGRFERYQPDAVVAVGGGSTLDTAKMLRLLPGSRHTAELALRGETRWLRSAPPPLATVSTTAGTGSDVTQFATVYLGRDKLSLDDPRVRPDVALVDPLLTASCPAALTATCALDAMAHAIESIWSMRSSPESRALAGEALARLLPALRAGARAPSPAWRTTLCQAAVLAGHAINLTRTTAGHAFAYPTTAYCGVPHGLACALHLVWLAPLTLARAGDSPRGADFVPRRCAELARLIGAPAPEDIGTTLATIVRWLGFGSRLGDHGIRPVDTVTIADAALRHSRLANHPVGLDRETVLRALRSRL